MPARSPLSRPIVAPPEPGGEWATAALVGVAAGLSLLALWSVATGRSLSPLTWELARSSGMTLYLLFWLSAITGLGLTSKALDRFGGRLTIYSLHSFSTRLGYAFLALHLGSLFLDSTVHFGLRALVVPFVSGWREPWTGLGVLAAELFVLVAVSFSLRRLIGYRAWRALHWLTYLVFALGLLHSLGSGSDSHRPWALALYLAGGLTVAWLAIYRSQLGPFRLRPGQHLPPPAAPVTPRGRRPAA